jgi:hypothetical protein
VSASGDGPFLVLPTQARRPAPKHAFEEALDEARAAPEDDLSEFIDAAFSNSVSGPAVGSIGDVAVAAGYVASAGLARAYEADEAEDEPVPEAVPLEPPGEAARKLVAELAGGALTTQELKRMRRRFAAANHPDRVAPEARPEALAAMADVNAAIDRALKAAQRRGPT